MFVCLLTGAGAAQALCAQGSDALTCFPFNPRPKHGRGHLKRGAVYPAPHGRRQTWPQEAWRGHRVPQALTSAAAMTPAAPQPDRVSLSRRRQENRLRRAQFIAPGSPPEPSSTAQRVGRADTGTPYVTPFPSPDGEPIALTRSVVRVNQLCVMRADGSQLQQSTFGDVPSMFPAWSPRGDRLVHVRGDPSAKAPTGRLAVLTLARG